LLIYKSVNEKVIFFYHFFTKIPQEGSSKEKLNFLLFKISTQRTRNFRNTKVRNEESYILLYNIQYG